ncbi:MAG TPA: hypothetical protein VFH19_03085 [Nitrososphaeraceae archaeon]|jgi:hypothetical protein|nr:hypothetical protein [Nitrososphaeraceae archaeon]
MCNETLKSTGNSYAKYWLLRHLLNAIPPKGDFIININLTSESKGRKSRLSKIISELGLK